MTNLGKNRVYDIGQIQTLKNTAVNLLATGIDSCMSWDNSISELQSLISQAPVKSPQLGSALDGVSGKLYQSDYEVDKSWVEGALNNIITNIPSKDMGGAATLEPLTENTQLAAGMIEDLVGCIALAGSSLSLEEFKERLEGVKQDWDYTTLAENLQTFETNYIGMLTNACFGADPVNMSTGNFIYQYTDLKTGGERPLTFMRTYNAMSRHKGILGRCWTHNWEKCLVEKEGNLVLYHEDGRQEPFEQDSTFTGGEEETSKARVKNYVGKEDVSRRIIKNTDGRALLIEKKGVFEYFDKDGRLLLREEEGTGTILHYEEDRLAGIFRNTGEALYLEYAEDGSLTGVEDHTGRRIRFFYEKKKLASVQDPEGYAFSYEYGSNGRISRIRDKRNVTILENQYDEYRRVALQRFPDGGIIKFDYQDKRKALILTGQDGSKTTYIHDRKCRSKRNVYKDGYEEWEYTGRGQIKRKRDKNGNETICAYDENGNHIEQKDALGIKTEKTYDEKGRLTAILYGDGSSTAFSYDEKGRLKDMTGRDGEKTVLSYEAGKERPVAVTLADKSTMHLTYDEKGNILSVQYPDGTGTSYEYDALSRVIKSTDGNGNTTCVEYDGLDRIKNITRADGASQYYTYNPMGEALKVEDFDGYSMYWEYNDINKPVVYTDKEGRQTRMEYDLLWNMSCITDPEGGSTRYTYDGENRLLTVTDPLERSVHFSYDGNGNRTEVAYPDGTSMQYAYDAMDRIIKETDRVGRTTLTEYDAMGNPVCITDNAGNKTIYEYDKAGRKIKETDRTGAETAYTYTALGKTDTITHPGGRVERFYYGPGGRLDKHDKGNGTWEAYTYDGNGNLTGCRHGDGRTYTYAYDCLNRMTEISLNGQHLKSYTYDAMGNMTSMTDALGRKTTYRYSPMGNLLHITDAEGNRVFYSYNGRDELTGILQMQKGEMAEFFTDTDKNDLQDEDWLKIMEHNRQNHDLHLTLLTRDKAGQIIKMTDALGREDHYEYDCMGKVSRRMDQEGKETLWEYCPDGQVSAITYPDGKKAVYSYDALARLEQIKDWLGETAFTYDAEGRLIKSTDHNGDTFVYGWNPDGSRDFIQYPDGTRAAYGYDGMGRLTRICSGDFSIRYDYDTYGRLSACKRGNGIKTRYDYDENSRLTGLIHEDEKGILDAFSCIYDVAGNRTRLSRKSREEGYSFDRIYGYDGLDRLIEIQENGQMLTRYIYDGYGNRNEEQQYKQGMDLLTEPLVRQLTYNAMNQLVSEGEHTYIYDAKGSLSQVYKSGEEVSRRSYDSNGLLTGLQCGGQVTQQNTYNGIGVRTESSLPDKAITYAVDYSDSLHRIFSEKEQNGNVKNYLWQDNTLLGMPQEGIYALTDFFHSPVRVTDKEGTTQNLYGYDEYGILKSQKESLSLSFGFTGYLKETIPQLYFTGSREYNTRDGRFQSKDQYRYMDYQDPVSINLYTYAKGNPLKYLDYDGHECIGEKSCMERILEMLLFRGASDEATEPGTFGSMLLGFIGLDYPMDIRNLAACFTVNFNPGDPSWWQSMGDCLLSFLPIAGGLKFLDKTGLLKYANENVKVVGAPDDSVMLQKDIYLDEELTFDSESYWNRQDGYFSGNWWLDEEKKQEALNALLIESLLADGEAGGYDLMTHYMETEPGSAKRYALQLMFQLEPTDGDDETVLNNIAGACARNGIDLAGNGWVIAPEVMMVHAVYHEELQAECDMNEKSLVSFMLNFIPVVGEIKSVAEAISGKDTITQEELSDFERVLGLAAGFCDVLSIGMKGGKITSLADMMSPEDAEKYLKFLETGSTAGLTSSEIAAIEKLDELRALEKIDYQDILDMRNANKIAEGGTDALQIGKTDLDALRNKLGVPETDTIAVGKTDVKGLEGVTFEGQSPKVRSEAGLPDLDEIWAGRNIKSPGNNPLFTRHAEEVLANDFDRAVIEAGINPQDVSGVLKIHQSNPTGVCRKCIQGLANDNVSPGVLKQLSLKYPNLRIEVTSEILPDVKVTGKSNFVIQNGQYVE